ncbi:hypothetical protein C1646_769449 [Rhizophagus diaphanus]|nr:hypothetical protein C1646_769449 [Rhizophagus diaphanus] [Rhizophagus sp. MUCL 43196]
METIGEFQPETQKWKPILAWNSEINGAHLPSNSKKMKSANSTSGRPKKPIWRFFEQEDEIDKGHYIAICLACKQTFHPSKTLIMEKHIHQEII